MIMSKTKVRLRKKEKAKTKKELEAEIEELKDQLLRKNADFENYKKQLTREKTNFIVYANEKLITDLLTTVDNLERAVKEIRKKEPESAQGIEMIYQEFMKVLEGNGLKKINALGGKLDPYYHEVFMQEPSDEPEGTIIEELQPGYMLNLKVIRHSKVKVSKG